MINRLYTDHQTKTKFWYLINNVDDLIDLDDNPYLDVDSFVEFFSIEGLTTERAAKQKARNIITDFFRMVAEDLIENNDVFVFPQYRFGRMYVGDVSGLTWKGYHRNVGKNMIDAGGKTPGLKLIINGKTNRYSSKMYRGKFNRVNSNRITNKVLQGHKY